MDPKILIIGATGFVGSNLLNHFEDLDIPIRVLARTPEKVLKHKETTEVVKGDLEKPQTLKNPLKGIETIYYLAHAMGESGDGFVEKEKIQIKNFTKNLTSNQKVIYLGGIIPDVELSDHLKSRFMVGEILRESKATILEFRASIIIGQGSASYEMIRALVARLPFLLKTKWMNSLCQPIALNDVMAYLTQGVDLDLNGKNEIINIGGKDQLPYGELGQRYAKYKNLKRPTIEIENFPKEIAGELLQIVAPEYAVVGKKLLESIELETIVLDSKAKDLFAEIEPLALEESFKEVKDIDMAQFQISEILKKLKNHKTIPQYLSGQVLQTFVALPNQLDYEGFINKLNKKIPYKLDLKEEISFKIPFAGKMKLNYLKDKKGVLVSYTPKYFFQSLGWVAWDQMVSAINQLLQKER